MCIFCKIIKGDLPAHRIYEDERSLAFLDIKPNGLGHTLVIPKTHSVTIEETSEEDLKHLALVIKKVGARLKDKLKCPAYNIILNNGKEAGQEIPHLHFHLIPRQKDSEFKSLPTLEYAPGQIDDLKKLLEF